MSSQIRTMVRSVIAPTSFTDTIQLFFAEIKGLVNATFYALYDEVHAVAGKDEGWQRDAMTRALGLIQDSNNRNTLIDSIIMSDEVCQNLSNLYFSAMHRFARDVGKSRTDVLNTNFQPLGFFLSSLFQNLAGKTEMRQHYFVAMSYTERDIFLRDVLRQVMFASLQGPRQSVVLPPQHSLISVLPPPPATTSAESFSVPVLPSASISNISTLKPSDITPQMSSALINMGSVIGMSVAKSVLLPQNKSRYSSFTAASVQPQN